MQRDKYCISNNNSGTSSSSSNSGRSGNETVGCVLSPERVDSATSASAGDCNPQLFNFNKNFSNSISTINRNGTIGNNSRTEVLYREKRNPLSSTRLSCYKPLISNVSPEEEEAAEDITVISKSATKIQHYKSVDDFMFLNSHEDSISNSSSGGSSDCSSDLTTIIQAFEESNCQSNSLNILSSESFMPKTAECRIDAAREHLDEDGTYGFSRLKSKSIENMYKINLNKLTDAKDANNMSQNQHHSGSAGDASEVKMPKNKNLSSKFRSMSDKTQRLFSKLYSTSKTNIADAEMEYHSNKPTKATSTIVKNRRSFSYGNLPGIHEFQKDIEICDDNEIKSELREEEHLVSYKSVKYTSADCEDGDSGILVNESGASSMLETDEYFNDHTLTNELTGALNSDFKLVRLRVENSREEDDIGLGIMINEIKNPDSHVHSSRFKIAHIMPGGVVER